MTSTEARDSMYKYVARILKPQTLFVVLSLAFVLVWMYSGYCLLTCPFHWLTGLQCPLCGMQRFLSALLHLHPIEAMGYNPWLVILMPYCAVLFFASISQRFADHRVVRWCCKDRVVFVMTALTIVWGVVRNI